MIPMSLAEVAEAVGGELSDAEPNAIVDGAASVDSRAVDPGGLFVAVRGERLDGHDFAPAAVAAGALAALAERPVGVPAVLSDDSVRALGRLARAVVDRLSRCQVIGITGSQGKTGTKDLVAEILERVGVTVSAFGSYNNEIGVPLTALRADFETQHLLVEMGARGRGHIAYLCEVTPPDLALVLNVGVAHLGEFGTRAGIAEAKAELVEAFPAQGLPELNADDPSVLAMAKRTEAAVSPFGAQAGADIRLSLVKLDQHGRPKFRLATPQGSADIRLRLVGEHQAHNAAAAAAIALGCGAGLDLVVAGLEAAQPRSRWRMEVHERSDGVVVINDAYNANPDSMRAALRSLAALRSAGSGARRTVAVLGEMRELGAASRSEHEALGKVAADLGICALTVVGGAASPIADGAAAAGLTSCQVVPDVEAALRWLGRQLRPGDVVLVKASRAAGLERVAQALQQELSR